MFKFAQSGHPEHWIRFLLQAFPEESSPVGPAADVAQVGVDAVHRRRAERE